MFDTLIFDLKVLILLCQQSLALNITYQIRLKKEQDEKEQKRKEKAEAHLYTIIKVTASAFENSCVCVCILHTYILSSLTVAAFFCLYVYVSLMEHYSLVPLLPVGCT